MTGLGWNAKDQPGCVGGSDAGASAVAGTFCLFGREEGAKKAVLLIFAAQDDKTKETQVWYARFDGASLSSK